MPELPEVEVLVRYLQPALAGKLVQGAEIRRMRIIRPSSESQLAQLLTGKKITKVSRRAKFILFELEETASLSAKTFTTRIVAHLGMTGRMYFLEKSALIPKHAAVVLEFECDKFVFEDVRGFGRFTDDLNLLAGLGPEPFSEEFNPAYLSNVLKNSRQSIKVKLMDQHVVAGIGNIYSSEALFRARISPQRKACSLRTVEINRVVKHVRQVLKRAIEFGSSISLNWTTAPHGDRIFYYGAEPGSIADAKNHERFAVYDRAGAKCSRCKSTIKRIVQAQRSTYYCPTCQQ